VARLTTPKDPLIFVGDTAEAIFHQIERSAVAVEPGDAKTPVSLEH
jgi:hypothetical protein